MVGYWIALSTAVTDGDCPPNSTEARGFMNQGALTALEFDRIVEAARSFAQTPFGAARLEALRPSRDPGHVERALALTGEMAEFLDEREQLSLEAPEGVDASLGALAIAGGALEPLQLRAVADFLASIERSQAQLLGQADRCPRLARLVEGVASFAPEVAEIRRVIPPSGELIDTASPQLEAIRQRLRKQRSRLRSTLQSFLRSRDTARYLQDEIVTDRNGRYVLLVKSEHRATIPGIVHGSSASGSTLFLEPLSTVEINNDVVALEQQEAEEVRRILRGLSNALRQRATELHRAIDVATDLDVVQAKAKLGRAMDAVAPTPSPDGQLALEAARHPLLIPAVISRLENDQGSSRPSAGPVPVDIRFDPPTTVLLITGPNTGGKTVALKTVGVLALMAQAGLHVPAASATLPVFGSVFADIGDEQSIAANLSTFSWHVTNIAAMDRDLRLPALVLLDEIGAGTDPTEGGSLGMAVIEHFRERGSLVLATTHSDMLKSYAATATGVECAAFGFDPESFAPSYRLMYGAPGRSLALEIADRLGLPAAVITSARRFRSEREAQLADHLTKVEQQLQTLEHDRAALAESQGRAAEVEASLGSREAALREREETLKQRRDDKVDRHLREARGEIDAVVADLKRQVDALTADIAARDRLAALTTGDTGALRAGARHALDAVESAFQRGTDAQPTASAHLGAGRDTPRVGEHVRVGGLGLEGVLTLTDGRDGEVEVHGKRLRVSLDELTSSGGAARPAPAHVSVQVQELEDVSTDLNVIGCRVDEAQSRAEKFLDQAILSEARTVRIIHGHGTGKLRRGLGEFLKEHPLVTGFRSAPPAEGGGGVTVVELKD